MSQLSWTESLEAPQSIATRERTAVVVIEDPGLIEVHLSAGDSARRGDCGRILGVEMPAAPWQSVSSEKVQVVWVAPWRWQILLPREEAAAMTAALAADIGAAHISDQTGALSCLRIAGETAQEILARVCPLDLTQVEPGFARGTSIARVRSLLIREQASLESWLVLAPRSLGKHVQAALVEAARTPGRLALFAPTLPPLV